MENKTGKYLKYAIGEIILVVIGILIALYINNWNQTLNDSAKEGQILITLQREMDSAKKDIEYFRSARKHHETKLRDYLMTIMDSTLTLQQKAAIPIPGIYDKEISYIPNYLNSIIYSGDLNLITNDSLKVQLSSWQNLMTNLRENSMKSEEFFSYLNEHMPNKLVEDNNYNGWTETSFYSEEELTTFRMRFVNDFKFHNKITLFIKNMYNRRGTLKHALKRTERIQQRITQEFKKLE